MNHILFLDIETVSQEANYELLSPEWKELWNKKAEALLKSREEETVQSIYNRAGIYAEFGRIICISCGVIQGYGDEKKIAVKSYFGHEEALLLHQFSDMLRKWSADGNKYVCAHNGKEFDFPYLCRRMIINNVPIPSILNTAGKKPWEVNHLDTMELWKFGDFKSYTSLNLLAHTLGIPTPKDDIDGSMVGDVYWNEKNLERIAIYCQKDVVTAAQIYLRIQGESIIKPENIEYK
ncbi:MAG: 3'-5' exonuclease [Chitinophagaceae bacterium]|uniref:3'-5' exonuclease n=1 Tax=unclassified Paraflavitalea TaxID=2798305 RepID=UPI003D33D27C|nr:3'-5' exonuclease [Chitinophagaceae bacterium]